jgi:O-antigen ligase
MIILWMVTSIVAGPVVIGLVVLSALALKAQNKYTELIAGLWVVCTFSDNRWDVFSSFETAKFFYLALMALFLIFDNKKFFPINKFYQRYIPFMLVAFYCLVHTPSNILVESFSKTVSYFFLLLLVPNYISKSYRDNGYDFIKLLFYVSVFILTLGFILKIFAPFSVTLGESSFLNGRYRGMLGNPNGMGLYCLVIFLFFRLINKSLPTLFHRQERNIFYLLIIISVYYSNSRNSIFAILIFLMFSTFTRISPVLGFIILLFILTGYEYININIVNLVKSLGLERYFRVETLANAAGRYVAWKLIWDRIAKDIFLGHGFDYTNYICYTFRKTLNDLGNQGNAHNSFLTFWLDTGIVGLILFLGAFVGSFIRAARKNRVIIAALFAILFSAFFESYLTSSLTPYTIIIIIMLTVYTSDEILPIQTEAIIPLH